MKARKDALDIYAAALRAVDAEALVRRHLRVPNVAGRVRVLGAGKAAAAMARGAEAVLGDRLDAGLVVVKEGHGLPLERVEVVEAGHPEPDTRSEAAGRRFLDEVRAASADDLFVGLWSGGGSALLEVLASGSLDDLREAVAARVREGAGIAEVNALRTQLSAIKGGRLAAAGPARWLNLVLSDVAGDDPALVASGPTVRPGDGTIVIGRLADAVQGALSEAFALRYATTVLDPEVSGEAAEVGARLAAAVRSLPPGAPPLCLVCAGEPVVTLGAAPGRGGRMQEAALAAALGIEGTRAVVLCAGTDGTDGPTDAAGALVDGGTATRIRAAGLDPRAHLRDHDAHPALDAAGDLLRTGPTRTNVRDLMVALVPQG